MIKFLEEPIWEPIWISDSMGKIGENFEKSTLLADIDEGEEELDQYGRKKHKGYSLKNLEISEISLCQSGKVNAGKYLIQKGDDKEMDEEKELMDWENVSESEISKIRETIAILRRYDLTNDLRRAEGVLSKYFGEGTEVKKYSPRCEWSQTQRILFGYNEDDLAMIKNTDIYEIEKSDEGSKWPSLTRQFSLNERRLEKAYEEYGLESRLV